MISEAPLVYYFHAKRLVYESGYFKEIYFQESVTLKSLSKADFYKEYAWVVLSSGMSERVVKGVFKKISLIFNDWKNPGYVYQNRERIFLKAINVFNNHSKISAIIDMAKYLSRKSLSYVINKIQEFGTDFLMEFKYLGPATSYHLAKNVGIDIAKPDRHLVRIARSFGYDCVNSFCRSIASITGDKKSVVDIVLWRYATLNKNYLTTPNA